MAFFDEFIYRLKEKQEIVILGEDREAQDTYDLLMAHDIDICCFAVPEESDGKLLGKQVMSIEDAMQCFERPIFLNYRDIHGALGEEWTEYFDYRGYERNKQYFLVRDYTDIPTSNLIHILHAKNVLLTGDPALCRLLSDYLDLIENNEITVRYISLFEKVSTEKADILCLVVPDYSYNAGFAIKTEKNGVLKQNLSEMGFVGYTDYFACSRCFALVDLYLNKDTAKELLSLKKSFTSQELFVLFHIAYAEMNSPFMHCGWKIGK